MRIFQLLLVLTCLSLAKPLEVWIMPNGASPQKVMGNLLDKFKSETGIDYRLKILDWGEAWGRAHDALERKQGPHLIQMGTTWLPYFASRKWLTPQAKKGDKAFDRFHSGSLETCTFDGSDSLYASPWFIDLRYLMANKGYLDSLKITKDELKDWKSFRKVLKKIKASDLKVDGLGFPGKSDWNIPHNFAPWVWSEGGSFLIKDSGHWRSNILAPQSIRGIRRYIGLVLDSLASTSTLGLNTASVSQRFNNGEQVFIIGTTEVLAQSRIPVSEGGLKSSAIGKMGLSGFSIPSGSHGSLAFLGGSHLAIPIKHQKDKRAKQLLEFLTRSENLLYYSKKIGFLPSDQKSLKILKQDSLYRSLIEILPYSKSYPNHPEWGSIGALLIEMFTAIWSLVDVEGFYSDAELYEIMIQYNRMLNHQMGYEKQETIPTIEEFKSYLDAPDEVKLSKKENKPKNTLILWVGGIFFILLVIWALFRSKNSMG